MHHKAAVCTCSVALLLNVGAASSVSLFPFTRIIGPDMLLALSVRLFPLFSVFLAGNGTADAASIGMCSR